MDTKQFVFKDISTFKYGKLPKKEKIVSYSCNPIYTGYQITGYYDEPMYEEPKLIVVARGVGGTGDVKISPPNAYITNLSIVCDVNTDFADINYLKYYFAKNNLRYLNSGASIAQITIDDLQNVILDLPELDIQNKIVQVLSNYDDLIENNNKRIKILEEMAQKIYKEWFVDFKFPNHETATFRQTDLGKIPTDWEVVLVESLLKRLKAKNKYTQDNVISQGKTIVIDQSTAEFLGFHNNEPDFYANPEKPLIIFGDHTCKMQMLVENFSIGPNVIPITSDTVPIAFLYYLIDSLIETKEYKRHWNDLIAKKVILPTNNLTMYYSKIITPIMATINHLKHKNMNLKQTRDLLLPRLISGEIDVENMEII